MIGQIYTCTVEFYDSRQHKLAWKGRPILIIGGPEIMITRFFLFQRLVNGNIWM